MPVEEDPAHDGRARKHRRARDGGAVDRDDETAGRDDETADRDREAVDRDDDSTCRDDESAGRDGGALDRDSGAVDRNDESAGRDDEALDHGTEGEAHEVYDASAESYADTNHEVAARAEYEWPMVQALLPDLDGKRVLDAGTGAGHYAALLADRGAEVVGVDASAAMVEVARERHGDAAAFRQADLREALPFEDGRFDVVVCQLTLEHVRDWDPVMAEFARVLDGGEGDGDEPAGGSGGELVLSTDHPFSTYFVVEHEPPDIGSADADAADYYAVEYYERDWGSEDEPRMVPFYRRPLREVLRPLFDAGLVVEDLREPAPETDHELLGYFDDETPRFLGLRARVA